VPNERPFDQISFTNHQSFMTHCNSTPRNASPGTQASNTEFSHQIPGPKRPTRRHAWQILVTRASWPVSVCCCYPWYYTGSLRSPDSGPRNSLQSLQLFSKQTILGGGPGSTLAYRSRAYFLWPVVFFIKSKSFWEHPGDIPKSTGMHATMQGVKVGGALDVTELPPLPVTPRAIASSSGRAPPPPPSRLEMHASCSARARRLHVADGMRQGAVALLLLHKLCDFTVGTPTGCTPPRLIIYQRRCHLLLQQLMLMMMLMLLLLRPS
jgi:hypothetical protein